MKIATTAGVRKPPTKYPRASALDVPPLQRTVLTYAIKRTMPHAASVPTTVVLRLQPESEECSTLSTFSGGIGVPQTEQMVSFSEAWWQLGQIMAGRARILSKRTLAHNL